MKSKPTIYWIDLFCGAGGTSTGIHLASKRTKVVACVNHNAEAIAAHTKNHPDAVHFTEDVWNLDVVEKLRKIVEKIREADPRAVIALWASLECTNFSNAKGGGPKDADSRTLAEAMHAYIEALNPDYFWVENVREFMSWGPLDENGKPVSRQKGEDYLRWVSEIQDYGFRFDYRIMNSADFGACQARERLFLQFVAKDLPMTWPKPTHHKTGQYGLKVWRAVRDVLELEKKGNSIFNRKKDLAENTLQRILKGLIKEVGGGEDYSGRVQFLTTYYGQGGVHSLLSPSPTVTVNDRIAIKGVQFLDQQYGNSLPTGIEKPIGTLTANPKFAIVRAKSGKFMANQYSGGGQIGSIDNPCSSVTGVPKQNLVSTEFIYNPGWGGHSTSVKGPCITVIARQDKAPLSIVSVETGEVIWLVYEGESETMVKIKEFCVAYGIVDIDMRMLYISELKRIQGFPEDYVLVGNQKEQKKQIGNAVEVNQAKAIVSDVLDAVDEYFELAA